MNTYIYTHI